MRDNHEVSSVFNAKDIPNLASIASSAYDRNSWSGLNTQKPDSAALVMANILPSLTIDGHSGHPNTKAPDSTKGHNGSHPEAAANVSYAEKTGTKPGAHVTHKDVFDRELTANPNHGGDPRGIGTVANYNHGGGPRAEGLDANYNHGGGTGDKGLVQSMNSKLQHSLDDGGPLTGNPNRGAIDPRDVANPHRSAIDPRDVANPNHDTRDSRDVANRHHANA